MPGKFDGALLWDDIEKDDIELCTVPVFFSAMREVYTDWDEFIEWASERQAIRDEEAAWERSLQKRLKAEAAEERSRKRASP